MKKFLAFLIVGIILLHIFAGFIVMGFILRGQSVEDYDDWVKDPDTYPGSEITVTGEIDKKENTIFYGRLYYFEGSDEPFSSVEEWAEEDETITVDLQMGDDGIPFTTGYMNLNMCWIPGVIFLIIGVMLIIVAIIFKQKEGPKMHFKYQPQYPPQYPTQYPTQPYQYPPQPPPPPPPPPPLNYPYQRRY
ncbi:MAG: hypothetical protein JSV49_12675 [Thermoplasmata archaeon]|nr:MAG: hypothetical protein JSV49_12675 [Thermoplasmata archaeon]